MKWTPHQYKINKSPAVVRDVLRSYTWECDTAEPWEFKPDDELEQTEYFGKGKLYPPGYNDKDIYFLFVLGPFGEEGTILTLKHQEEDWPLLEIREDEVIKNFRSRNYKVEELHGSQPVTAVSISEDSHITKKAHKYAPNRTADYEKWVIVWRLIKPWIKHYGMDISSIREALNGQKNSKQYRGPVYKNETFRKIIRAGNEGELGT